MAGRSSATVSTPTVATGRARSSASASCRACSRPSRTACWTTTATISIPHKIWARHVHEREAGRHGERSVAVGTIDMAVWDAVAKIAGKPLFRLLAERARACEADPRVFVYAAGGYYYPGKGLEGLADEMQRLSRSRLHGREDEDRRRAARRGLQAHRGGAARCCRRAASSPSTPMAASISRLPSRTPRRSATTTCSGTRRPAIRSTIELQAKLAELLSGPDGDRREPVLDAGCAQSHPLRRHASRPRLAAVRLRAELRPRRVSAHARDAEAATAGRRRRCIPHGGHQMSLNIAAGLGSAATRSYPDLFQPFGGFPDGVRVEDGHIDHAGIARHRLRRQIRPDHV